MARKKPDPPAPEPDDNQEEWRRPSVRRAHERNVVTYLDKVFGDYGKAVRDAKGFSQPEVAERLLLPDGTPHPVTWGWRRRIGTDLTKKDEKTTRDMRAKSISRFEAAELAPTTSLFIALDGRPRSRPRRRPQSHGPVEGRGVG